MWFTCFGIVVITVISGLSYKKYRDNKNKEKIRNLLNKYMIIEDNSEDSSENNNLQFNEFRDQEVDL